MSKRHSPANNTAEREVPVVARKDLLANEMKFQGEPFWVVKDPLRLKYFRLNEKQYAVLQLLDGQRCAEQIRSEFMQRFPGSRPSKKEIYRLVFDVCKLGLAWSTRPGQSQVLENSHREQTRKKLIAALTNLLFIKLPGWDPQRFLDRHYSWVRWMFQPLAIVVGLLLVLFSCAFIATNFAAIQHRIPSLEQLASWHSLLTLWIVIGVTKIAHELGHAFCCKHFGGECHEIGAALLIFSPCMYCDVSDSWILSEKWKRIFIAAAGMYVELVLSAVAFIFWLNTQEGSLNQLLFTTFAVTSISVVVFNLNPLLRLDGYYILCDLLEIPNLRQKSDKILGRFLGRLLLGIKPPDDPTLPSRGLIWLAIYACASAIYRWTLVLMICFILYEALKPYHLQSLGFVLGVLSMIFAGGSLITKTARYVAAQRDKTGRSPRAVATLAVVGIVLALVFLAPIPWYRAATCYVEPADASKVFTGTPGRLKSVFVADGDYVRKGQILAVLSNPDREDRYFELRTACQVQQIEVQSQHAAGDIKLETKARETLQAIRRELMDHQRQLRRMMIVAPCDGRVISPAWKPSATGDQVTLPTWSGVPLSQDNVGCFIDSGVHFCSIASTNRYHAVMSVEQFDRNDFVVDSRVKLKADHQPDKVIVGKLLRIATATQYTSLLDGSEGNSPTSTRHDSSDYQAIVQLDSNTHDLFPGMKANARVLVAQRTTAEWIWRYVRSNFNFAL